ncbi:MAG: GH3 auxin-responsive promoter family protein [Gammaproteobacteria bacterium]|nr:GH3 auxin-responsive promoter family protein [Gammaproteobacteria bacterium]
MFALLKLKHLFIHLVWLASCIPNYLLFRIAIGRVKNEQEKVLHSILKTNQTSRIGHKYSFDTIDTTTTFQKQLPLTIYEDYVDPIKHIGEGEESILTSEPISFLQPSSGSTSPSKFLPFTTGLRKQYQRGIKAWLFDLMWSHPSLMAGCSYWSITPANTTLKDSGWQGKLPIDFDDDINYLGLIDKLALHITGAVPKDVGHISDTNSFKYTTLLFMILEKNIRLLSVWSPTFLLLLFENIESLSPRLINDIANGTLTLPNKIEDALYSKLQKRIKPNPQRATALLDIWSKEKYSLADKLSLTWPNMKLISAWADASAEHSIRNVQNLFPGIEIQGKGLITTEAFVTFPLFKGQHAGIGSVLAIRSHFYEFIPYMNPDNARPLLAYELEQGTRYSIVVTTAGGLYRYQLQDIVEVTGFVQQAPILTFCGKVDHVVDITGEKINAQHVSDVLLKISAQYDYQASFQLLAPESIDNSYSYTLYLSMDISPENISSLAHDLDEGLSENYHYRYCRSLGQLAHPRVFLLDEAAHINHIKYLEQRTKNTRLGDIKPTCLDKGLNWSKHFQGEYISQENVS